MMKIAVKKYCKFITPLVSLMLVMVFLTGCPKPIAALGKGDKKLLGQTGRSENSQESLFPTTPITKESVTEEELASSTASLSIPSDMVNPHAANVALVDVFFEFGLSTLGPKATALLEKNAKWLEAHPEVKVEIGGHADSRGTNEYNLVLGEKRSKAIEDYLIQLGIDSSRLLVISYGEERPFCDREDDSCYEENRRANLQAK